MPAGFFPFFFLINFLPALNVPNWLIFQMLIKLCRGKETLNVVRFLYFFLSTHLAVVSLQKWNCHSPLGDINLLPIQHKFPFHCPQRKHGPYTQCGCALDSLHLMAHCGLDSPGACSCLSGNWEALGSCLSCSKLEIYLPASACVQPFSYIYISRSLESSTEMNAF